MLSSVKSTTGVSYASPDGSAVAAMIPETIMPSLQPAGKCREATGYQWKKGTRQKKKSEVVANVLLLPVELWHSVIDAVYYHDIQGGSTDYRRSLQAVRSCGLICRAWWPRARPWIFNTILLEDVDTLYKFSALLSHTPAVAVYVQKLYMSGDRLHSPRSVVTFLPHALDTRLPNLISIVIVCPPAIRVPLRKSLAPCMLPIHPRFPLSFSRLSGQLSYLHLERVIFPSFADFSRTLQSLFHITTFICIEVRWRSQRPLLPSAASESALSISPRHMKLRNLEHLRVQDIETGRDMMNALLSTIGLSLSCLDISLPLTSVMRVATFIGHCNIRILKLRLEAQDLGFRVAHYNAFEPIMRSWISTSNTSLRLELLHLPSHSGTRELFFGLLNQIVHLTAVLATDKQGCGTIIDIVVHIKDRIPYQSWWREQLTKCSSMASYRLSRLRLMLDFQSTEESIWFSTVLSLTTSLPGLPRSIDGDGPSETVEGRRRSPRRLLRRRLSAGGEGDDAKIADGHLEERTQASKDMDT
ncbi:hypothetical protein L226DRAFT_539876 [Lentinus tigrinus ALCF2SS1-7]|uniref:Uncharacterized protein n=1 Tax=Lentinus tigrinus ALCF2SS1-6 TaxID=1328759 RepID=A0A5C2RSB4_9APHY|nr:hypothetical protein L227DRAFT_580487 [Lentinus tigrinus ALCF2SS1-6]RPD69363.1 hypothetical protein L226DRAFT_539876 [Lentinus tigrinus ALCF2SS1-7]